MYVHTGKTQYVEGSVLSIISGTTEGLGTYPLRIRGGQLYLNSLISVGNPISSHAPQLSNLLSSLPPGVLSITHT